MSQEQDKLPFLRFEILKFQINSSKTTIDLHELKTEVEIKERNDPRQACIYFSFFLDFIFIEIHFE